MPGTDSAPTGLPGGERGIERARDHRPPLWFRVYKRLSPRRIHAAFHHLDLAYGERATTRDKRAVLIQSLRHMFWLPFELVRSHLWARHRLFQRVKIDWAGISAARAHLDRGEGVLVISAHIGIWELGLRSMSMLFPGKFCVVSKPFPPAWLYRLLLRTRSGTETIEKVGATRSVMRALGQGKVVCVLMDQHRPDGIFVPLFGRPAKTSPLVPMIAVRSGTPVFTACCLKERGDYHLRIRALPLPHLPKQRAAVREATALCNQALERMILDAPEQFLWTHLRYRTEPPGMEPLYARPAQQG